MSEGHPIRNAEIHTFRRADRHEKGWRWVGKFYPYNTYPIIFHGKSEAEVLERAEAMRTEAIEKHEAAVIARQEAKRKAAETRAKKAGKP